MKLIDFLDSDDIRLGELLALFYKAMMIRYISIYIMVVILISFLKIFG